MPNRQPKQLLFAFFGEFVLDRHSEPIRASVLIGVLEGAGVAAPTTRATLNRLVRSGFLTRERNGREILFSLTEHGGAVLREATDRVRGSNPFEPHGVGWTLVTFSIPEDQRQLRHRLRSTLTWEGFAPMRDGLWLAPGEVDLDASLAPLRDDLPVAAISAFHARALPGFSIAESVQSAWDIEEIRAAHHAFIETWSRPDGETSALVERVTLVADWLELLSGDPRLPQEFVGEDNLGGASFALYRRLRRDRDADADLEFTALVQPRERAASH